MGTAAVTVAVEGAARAQTQRRDWQPQDSTDETVVEGAAMTDFKPTLEALIFEWGTKEALAWTEGDTLMREIILDCRRNALGTEQEDKFEDQLAIE